MCLYKITDWEKFKLNMNFWKSIVDKILFEQQQAWKSKKSEECKVKSSKLFAK